MDSALSVLAEASAPRSEHTAGGLPRWQTLAVLGMITAAGLALRLASVELAPDSRLRGLSTLAKDSYWWDEGWSLRYASLPVAQMIGEASRQDSNSPLYYALLHFWVRAFGDSESTTRLLSALLSAASIPLVYAVGRLLMGRRAALLSAVLLATAGIHVQYGQETRAYALLGLSSLLSMYAFLKLLRSRSWEASIAYILATVLMIYSHPYGLFLALAQNLYVFGHAYFSSEPSPSHGATRQWVVLQGLIGILMIPYGAYLTQREGLSAFAREIAHLDPPNLATPINILRSYAWSRPGAVVLGLLAAVGLIQFARQGSVRIRETEVATDIPYVGAPVILALWLLVPTVVPVVISAVVRAAFFPRYTIGAAIAFYMVVAVALDRLSNRRWVFAGLALLVLFLNLFGVYKFYIGDTKGRWRHAMQYVGNHAKAGDLVLFTDDPGLRNLGAHYLRRQDLIRASLAEDVTDLDANRLAARLAIADPFARVWLVVCWKGLTQSREVVLHMNERFGSPSTVPVVDPLLQVLLYERIGLEP